MTLCGVLPGPWLSLAGLALDLLGTLLLVCPLFFLRKRDVVRGGRALFWSQPDDPEARFLKRQLSVAVPGALLLTAGVGMQMLATWCRG
jgi:hypothetical protein